MSRWFRPMVARSPSEAHRVSTPLELLFDLVFVVAVNFAADGLHHDLTEDRIWHGTVDFGLVFFAIWLAWISFTWFASAYDVDDAPYRIATFVQMSGAIIFAAGVPRAFADRDFELCIAGYVVMRLALVAQWLRVASSDPGHRQTALRYACGITIVQIGWVIFGFVLEGFLFPIFLALALLDLLVPAWAERAGATTWHPHHIAERYGLFTIIVLGESVFTLAGAIQRILDSDHVTWELLTIPTGGVVMLFSMWWIYFDDRATDRLGSLRSAFIWGYGHCLVWAFIAMVGVGIGVCVDFATHHSELSRLQAQMALAIPTALFLLSLWIFHDFTLGNSTIERFATPVAALLILLMPWLEYAPLWIAAILVVLLVVRTTMSSETAKAVHA